MITFPELAHILLLGLNLQVDLPKEYRSIGISKNLTTKAAKIIRKNIKPLTQENLNRLELLPENLYNLLGLIRIYDPEDSANKMKISAILNSECSNSSFISIHNSDYLDVDSKEYFSKETFKSLIKKAEKIQIPFILAITTSEKNGSLINNCYDACALKNYLIKNDELNIKKDPQTLAEITQIKYFTIWDPNLQPEAQFLGTQNELKTGPKKIHMTQLFKAYSGDKDAQYFIYHLGLSLGLKENHPVAQYYYGRMQQAQDIEKAKEHLILSANQNFAPAHFYLSHIYHQQNRTSKELEHLEKAADLGLQFAQLTLGNYYTNIKPDIEKAKNYLMLAYKQGNIEAARNLGYIFQSEYQINDDGKSKTNAKNCFKFAAERGDSFSQLELANLLEDEDPNNQINYLIQAAQQNEMDALYELWQIYEEKKDSENSHFWLSKLLKELEDGANSNNSLEPLRQLINIYYKSNQIEESIRYGNLLLQKLTEMANNGDANVKYELARLHETLAKLQFKSLKKDAENGDPNAQVYIGIYYTTKNNEQEAIKYYKLAGKQKNVTAAFRLARIYKSKNKTEKAKEYFKIVIANGTFEEQLEAKEEIKNL